MFNNILVPLDGSALAERVIPHAEHFARVFGGKITLLQVLDPSPYHENPSAVEPLNWQIRKAEADVYLRDLVGRLRGKGITADYALREGRSPENIVDFAHQDNTDLLILSTHGASGLSRWSISGVVTKVMDKIYLPVLLVRAYQEMSPHASGGSIPVSGGNGGSAAQAADHNGNGGPHSQGHGTATVSPTAAGATLETPTIYQRVLLPIDSSRRAECALPAAVSLLKGQQETQGETQGETEAGGEEDKPTLILAAVINPPDLPIPAPYPEELHQLIDQFMTLSHSAVQNYLNEIQARVQVHSETRITEADSISAAIHDLVEKENIDLVVLCAHGQTGRINWPYGSVARNYIEHGTQALLVIQDVPLSQVRPTAAEIAAEKYGRR